MPTNHSRILTYTGRSVDVTDPQVEDIDVRDIAHALAKTCRFGGHCSVFYSVAEHSLLVARSLPPALRLEGLLHDAAEAYVGDVPRPFKALLVGFEELEARVHAVIARRFGLPPSVSPEVRQADDAMLALELEALMGGASPAARERGGIQGLAPSEAAAQFLSLFHALEVRDDR